MNILFLTTHANTGGISSYVLTLGEALVKSGHKVWGASSGGDCVPRMETAGIRHVKVNIRTKSELNPKLLAALSVLTRLVKKEKIDIIHAQTRVTQVLGFFISRSTGVTMVTTCHGFFRPRWFRKIFPCWGAAAIAISKPVAEHLKIDFGVPQDRIHLIANGIDLNRFVMTSEKTRHEARRKIEIGDDTPLIGIIARLSDVKGIDVLIKAMPRVLKELPQAHLIIAGQGPEEENLKRLVHDLSLTSNILLKSMINQTQELLSALDVFVMPSIMEGLGLSVMEAQACGIPVVASRVGGLVDLIDDGQSGLLVESQDTKALAGQIIKLLRNPQLGQQMALAARSNIERYFSVKTMLEKTLKVYEQYSRR